MFSKLPQYTGASLPDKSLCLTFDDGPGETAGDGPGPKTLKLAEYLYQEGVCATFFMVGKHINQYPLILPEVASLGHLIGNHTYCHAKPLPEALSIGWDIVTEIEMTDELIKKFNPANKIYFRAPWGEWNDEVADTLNQQLRNSLDHIGPFRWDIDGDDWRYWVNGQTAEEGAAAYLDKIIEANKGIILMHDSTADLLRAKINNRAYETIKILIPKLKSLGYQFIGLDKIVV